ncbi:uncharacterized protein [Prorops nasuta]|uniref:uncharacterized protein isoform X2 n=1 Tax=Prorops nasuta TaxID=863751 RepID=UPI0034CF4377
MTRRRKPVSASRLCIGTLLLLFSNGLATALEASTIPSSTFHQSESTNFLSIKETTRIIEAPTERSTTADRETVDKPNEIRIGSSIDARQTPSTERSVPIGSTLAKINEKLFNSNSKTKANDSTDENPEKSATTEIIFQDSPRLSRISKISTEATKVPREEISGNYETADKGISDAELPTESKKREELGDNLNKMKGITEVGEVIEESKDDRRIRENSKKFAAKVPVEPREIIEKGNKDNRRKNLDEELEDEKKDLKDLSSLKRDSKKNLEDFGEKSEVKDLNSGYDKERTRNDGISLIQDTYVNYKQQFKPLDEKEPGVSRNSTVLNNLSANALKDPKEDVEVLKSVTHPTILRLVLEESRRNETRTENQLENQQAGKPGNSRNSTNECSNEEKQDFGIDSSFKVDEGKIDGNGSTSPVPKGRTIEFSAVNKFSDSNAKSGIKEDGEKSGELSRKYVLDTSIEQKPYPYLKSTSNLPETTVRILDHPVTEEASAYENTIGRRQLEKKFVVTEPSVVVENSIQQLKLNHDKRSGNKSSRISTLDNSAGNDTGIGGVKLNEESTSGIENDVPRDNAKKDGNVDVTGNGITEISWRVENSSREGVTSGPLGVSAEGASTKSGTTKEFKPEMRKTTMMDLKSETRVSNSHPIDVQTNVDGSLLIRSTFNVSEPSIEFPVTKGHSAIVNSTTQYSMMVPLEATTVPPINVNVTTQPTSIESPTEGLPTAVTSKTEETILNPDETTLPTTTNNIEYEFVGLARSSNGSATEKPVPTTTVTNLNNSTAAILKNPPTTLTSPVNLSNSTSSNFVVGTTERGSTSANMTKIIEPEIEIARETTTTDYVDEGSTMVTDKSESTTFETTNRDEKTTTVSTTITDETTLTDWSSDDDRKTTLNFTRSTNKATTYPVTEIISTSTLPISEITELDEITTMPDFPAPILNTSTTTGSPVNGLGGRTDEKNSIETRIVPSVTSPKEETSEKLPEVPVTLSPEETPLVVRIVIEGSLSEICPRLPDLRKSLADLMSAEVSRQISAKQIVIHQSPCTRPESSMNPMEVSLTPILIYIVNENGVFDENMTKILPSLYNKVSAKDFPFTIHSFLLVQEADSGNAIAVIVISSVAFVCLIILVGLLFIMRKRQTRFNYGERCRPVSLDAYSLDSVSAYNSVRRKGAARSSKRSYGNPTFEDSSAIPSHPLNFAGLSSFCNDMNAINDEFSGIPQVSGKIDELPPGAEVKNRYANVVPLPETRVPLQRLNNDPLTEYINASYVRGPRNATKCYIACQAPIESTVTDFWRMIWEQQSKVIIMLTDLVESGVEKCTEYIPPSEVTDCHRLYGDFQVTLKKRETKEKYAISTLHLKNLENNTFREVYHIWYLWPVNGEQSDGTGLIAVLLEARALQRSGPGPIVVHCSPGTGRTGTLIALDLGIRQYEITRTVDVPRVVYIIRRDRAGAVQTKEQYAFIYKALNLYATKLAGGVLEST